MRARVVVRRWVALAVGLVRQVPSPVHCDDCRRTRSHIGFDEVAPLVEDGELPCPCGGAQVYVGDAGLAEAVGR